MKLSNKVVPLAASLLIAAVVTGCGARVKSYPFVALQDAKTVKDLTINGFVYGLPKTVFEVTGKYTLYRTVYWNGRIGGMPNHVTYVASLDDGLDVKPVGVLDENLRFRVDSEALRNWRVWTKKAEFKIRPDGTLDEINAELNDQTAEIIESGIKTAINVAKTMAIAAPSGIPGPLEKIGQFTAVGKVEPTAGNAHGPCELVFPPATLMPNLEAQALSNALQDKKESGLTETANPNGVTHFVRVAEPTLTITVPSVHQPSSAELKNELPGDRWYDKAGRIVSFGNWRKNFLNGIVSRVPGYFKTVATTKVIQLDTGNTLEESTQTAFVATLPIAQMGQLSVIPVSSHTFVEATKSLKLDGQTGAITYLNHSSTSSGKRAAKLLEDVSGSVVNDLPSLLASFGNKGGAAKNATTK